FVRDASGRAHPIRLMQEGDFFGEMALLTGRPRTATITAATACELLELHSDNVRQIVGSYPRVNNVLRAFCEIRMRNPAETLIRRKGAE
ncbi:MAG: cyclic nucleotide-binding domain-containing protein, partial [Acidobacteria bacterium]|nr:cyclic nucleotide-binding domain-containing protein [Acidobacteriota bacterium]